MLPVAILFTLLQQLAISHGQEIVVDLPEGRIAGHTLTSFLGNPYFAFQEIPYAAPPVGDLRFALPQPAQAWDGVLNTTKNTKQCMQGLTPFFIDKEANQTEDCLYLNVYTPQIPGEGQLLPVYVWIHGGGFLSGAGTFNLANPRRFMDYGIVVVAINYRLDTLGFLTTGDGVIPGNLGLKDQRFALRWIKSHIDRFGGDPEKITIGGESSGSISVGFHLLAQNSDGLISGAIMESGSPVSQMTYTPSGRIMAFALARALDPNFNSSDSKDVLELLKRTPAEDIITAGTTIESPDDLAAGYLLKLRWHPVIENETEEDAFVTTLMHDSFMTGNFHHVPVLMGFNSEEALTFIEYAVGIDVAGPYDRDVSLLIDSRLKIPVENKTFVGEELKKFYTNSTFTDDQAALVKLSTDSGFSVGMARHADVSSAYTSVYFYILSYMGLIGQQMITNRTYVPGAVGCQHEEDLSYLWDWGIPEEASGDDFLTMERMLKFWTNFIKYQNPTPEPDPIFKNITWPAVQGSDVQYLNINLTLEVRSNPRRYREISSLLLQYMEKPYVVI